MTTRGAPAFAYALLKLSIAIKAGSARGGGCRSVTGWSARVWADAALDHPVICNTAAMIKAVCVFDRVTVPLLPVGHGNHPGAPLHHALDDSRMV